MSQHYDNPQITPRWSFSNQDTVSCTVRYPACDAYVSYQYANNLKQHKISLRITGSGKQAHINIPVNNSDVKRIRVTNDGTSQNFILEH